MRIDENNEVLGKLLAYREIESAVLGALDDAEPDTEFKKVLNAADAGRLRPAGYRRFARLRFVPATGLTVSGFVCWIRGAVARLLRRQPALAAQAGDPGGVAQANARLTALEGDIAAYARAISPDAVVTITASRKGKR